MQRGNALIFILIGTLLLIVVAGGAFYLGKQVNKQPLQNSASSNISVAPETVVSNFYNSWLDCEKEFDKYSLQMGGAPEEVSQQRKDCILKVLKNHSIVQNENPTGSSMWCAQDLPHKVEVDAAEISGNTATVVSHHAFKYSGDNPIKVTLTLVDNAWKISDTTCLRLDSSNSDETIKWKTYEGKGYDISYPSSWDLDPSLKGLNKVTGQEGFVIISPDYKHNSGGIIENGAVIQLFVGRKPFHGNLGLELEEETTWLAEKAILSVYKYEGNDLVLTSTLQGVDYQLVMLAPTDDIRNKNKGLFLKVASSLILSK